MFKIDIKGWIGSLFGKGETKKIGKPTPPLKGSPIHSNELWLNAEKYKLKDIRDGNIVFEVIQ